MPEIPHKPYFRAWELPEFFGVKKKTIYNWVGMCKLEGIKLGGCLFIPRESIIELLREKKGEKRK